MNCYIRDMQERDACRAAEIYNSNRRFLLCHLGVERIDEGFILQEAQDMREAGFRPCVIVDTADQEVKGVLDFREDGEAYLSLLMLDADLQGKGLGRRAYTLFESEMVQKGSNSIRIDVVNDYPGNLVPFWTALGFAEGETVILKWGNKSSRAVVMRKRIL